MESEKFCADRELFLRPSVYPYSGASEALTANQTYKENCEMLKKIVTLAMAAVLAVSMVACGNTAAKPTATPEPVDLAAFGDQYVAAKQMPDQMDVSEGMGKDMLEMDYAGLSEIDTQQLVVYKSVMDVGGGEMLLVQTRNQDDVAKVKEIFQNHIDSKVSNQMDYPATIELWTNNAEIVTNGNYVMLVASAEKDSIVEAFNGLFA